MGVRSHHQAFPDSSRHHTEIRGCHVALSKPWEKLTPEEQAAIHALIDGAMGIIRMDKGLKHDLRPR